MNYSTSKILVVDDEALNRTLLKTALEEEGHYVFTASSGEIALEMLQHSFDAVLLDLVMPGINGFEVLRRMKANPEWQHIPVVVISASEDSTSAIRCIEQGAIDYLPKPFDAVFLKARVNASLAAKRYYDMQQLYLRELEARNEELDAFAHMVAHDLKSPLSLIITFSEYVRQGFTKGLDAEISEAIEYMSKGAYQAVKLIDDLLMLAEIRHVDSKLSLVQTGGIVSKVCEQLHPIISAKQATINLPEDEWPLVLGYEPWVEIVWTNYISNGLKYGGDTPNLELGATAEGNNMVRFWVRDHGVGIEEDQQAEVFRPFTRFHETDFPSYGIGLSIVSRIVNKLGGAVGVESKVGWGSRFWFTLPAA